jgi:hypothetical protein
MYPDLGGDVAIGNPFFPKGEVGLPVHDGIGAPEDNPQGISIPVQKIVDIRLPRRGCVDSGAVIVLHIPVCRRRKLK